VSEMDLVVLNKGPNTLVFELRGEGHTFCNSLREALLQDPAVTFAAYRIDHPLVSSPVFVVKTDGSKTPEDALREAAARIVALTKVFEEKALRALK
jgi:DNA-directed RNA polymerase subunit L